MSNEGIIKKASILLILLRCIALGYSNGNESFAGTLLSNYGPLNMLFQFFRISFIVFFKRLLSKGLSKNIFFQIKFQKPISSCTILQKIKMSNIMILKWWSFDYKVKSLKIFGVVFPEVKNADILDFSWMKYFCNDFSFHINDIYRSAIVKVKDRGTWKQNRK